MGTYPTQNKYKKIVVLKCCFQSRLDHGQSIERRIFISRLVETTNLDKYANKMFENDWFIDPEGGKLWLNFLFAVICREIFASLQKWTVIEFDSYVN